jgi:hypothetical protein
MVSRVPSKLDLCLPPTGTLLGSSGNGNVHVGAGVATLETRTKVVVHVQRVVVDVEFMAVIDENPRPVDTKGNAYFPIAMTL